jgi:erythritol kinase
MNTSQQHGQLAWLQCHEPQRLARAHRALHCKDWLYLCCTGRHGTDLAEGLFTFGNLRTMAYDPRVLELLGIAALARLLPPLVDGRREHAPLTAVAADATGLPDGLPVVLAPMDVPSTALGAGLYAPGRSVGCSILGSTGMHARLYAGLDQVPWAPAAAGAPVGAPGQPGYLWAFAAPGTFQGSMSHMAATLNIDWLCDRVAEAAQLAGGEPADRATLLARLEARAAQAEPGAAMFHPFIADNGERGPFTEPLARAQFTGLSSGTDLAALARAVWEGVAFATRDCYAALGPLPEEVRLTGGAARSPLLRRILADVMGCPVRASRRGEAGAAGAAIVAAVAIGRYRDVTEATPRWVDALLDAEATPPGPQRARYDALFNAYRDGYLGQFAHWTSLHHARHTPS